MDKLNEFQLKRIAKLGYLPQKEDKYNKYLPYADLIDEESEIMLTEIKENLYKAIAIREMSPGIVNSSNAFHR